MIRRRVSLYPRELVAAFAALSDDERDRYRATLDRMLARLPADPTVAPGPRGGAGRIDDDAAALLAAVWSVVRSARREARLRGVATRRIRDRV